MGKRSSSIFGDKRLEKGFKNLLHNMQTRHSVLLSELSIDDAQEAQFGRFVNNEKVDPDKLLSYHWNSSEVDFTDKHLLVISDSSTLSFKVNANREQLGPLAGTQTKEGFEIHPSIILDANHGACYGLGGIDFFQDKRISNEEEEVQKMERRKNCWKIPFEEKQSHKWFSSPQKAISNCNGALSYTLIGDRESDIYELMDKTLSQQWDFVYRSRQNRKLNTQQNGSTLYELLKKTQIADVFSIEAKQTAKRTAHRAKLALKFASIQLRTYHGLKNVCTLALTAALQIMQLVQARDGRTKDSIEQVFLPQEQKCINALNKKLSGKTEKSKNPHPPETLAFATWVIARLGGWKGYQNRKPPGPITFVNGLSRFYNILEGYYLII